MTFRALAVLLVAICLYLVIGVTETPRVAFVRPPSYVTDKEIVVLQVRVEPDSENRQLIVAAADGDFVVASSSEDLPGPRTRWVRMRLPAGELLLVAVLLDTHGEVARDTHPIQVRSFP
jgi:hypothetical protein